LTSRADSFNILDGSIFGEQQKAGRQDITNLRGDTTEERRNFKCNHGPDSGTIEI